MQINQIKIQQYLAVPLTIIVKFYRMCISPFLGNNCRHYPSCSQYSVQSLEQHGFIKGFILTIARIIRCNPWSLGGFDPVPKVVNFSKFSSFKLSGNYQTQLYKKYDL